MPTPQGDSTASTPVSKDRERNSAINPLYVWPVGFGGGNPDVNVVKVGGTPQTGRDWSLDFANLDLIRMDLDTVSSRVDVALSTRASEATLLLLQADLATVVARLDVALSTRASEANLTGLRNDLAADVGTPADAEAAAGNGSVIAILKNLRTRVAAIQANLDVALSTRASEATLAALNAQITDVHDAVAHALRITGSLTAIPSGTQDTNLVSVSGTPQTGRDWSLDLAKLQNLDLTITALRDALRGISNKTLTDLDTDLSGIQGSLTTITARLDVALSTRASEANLTGLRNDLAADVGTPADAEAAAGNGSVIAILKNLRTRVAAIQANLDVALSTRASEANLTGLRTDLAADALILAAIRDATSHSIEILVNSTFMEDQTIQPPRGWAVTNCTPTYVAAEQAWQAAAIVGTPSIIITQTAQAVPGRYFRFALSMERTAGAGTANARLVFLDAAGAALASTDGVGTASSDYARFQVEALAPAGTVYVSASVRVVGGAGSTWRLRKAALSQSSLPTAIGQATSALSLPVVIASDQDFVKAEDAVHVSGDKGIMALTRRVDTAPSSSAGTSGDYATLNTDQDGRAWSRALLDRASSVTGRTYIAAEGSALGVFYTVPDGKTLYVLAAWIAASRSTQVTPNFANIEYDNGPGLQNFIRVMVPGAQVLLSALGVIIGTMQDGAASGTISYAAEPFQAIKGVGAGTGEVRLVGGMSNIAGGFVGYLE